MNRHSMCEVWMDQKSCAAMRMLVYLLCTKDQAKHVLQYDTYTENDSDMQKFQCYSKLHS